MRPPQVCCKLPFFLVVLWTVSCTQKTKTEQPLKADSTHEVAKTNPVKIPDSVTKPKPERKEPGPSIAPDRQTKKAVVAPEIKKEQAVEPKIEPRKEPLREEVVVPTV
ncbi:MAG TPA: hypothetical protein VKQ08_00810, partial [Cyclobacteriaceae bacterium]|nr:hypothetical protein [Cyclobacteriaceae bacterium]